MNENIDLTKILKDCPKGTCFYSPICGNVEFIEICTHDKYPIVTHCIGSISSHLRFAIDGKYLSWYVNGECLLFPSKDQRDWSKWKCPKPKFDPKTLNPFDKVLVRDNVNVNWNCDFLSHIIDFEHYPYKCIGNGYVYCIPYNDDTKHLVGTTDEAPEYYRYWED